MTQEKTRLFRDMQTDRLCIPTLEARQRSGFSSNHLVYLLKVGKLEGVRVGREWLIYIDALDAYLATSRKTGPKKKQEDRAHALER